MALIDTSEAARQQQLAVYARTSGADKVLLACEMAEQVKRIAVDGVRSRNPELSETEVHLAWLHMLHGELAPLLTAETH